MSTLFTIGRLAAFSLAFLCLAQGPSKCVASEVLIVDRLSNAVVRYSSTGDFLGTLITDKVNLNEPTGIGISPDHTKLYVSSSQNSQVVEYNYDYKAGTATFSKVFATAADGLAFPNSIVFSPDGSKLYVANLGGTGIAQLKADGSGVAGAPIGGGSSFAFSGLAYNSAGQLLAGGFDGATVAISNAAITTLSDLVAPTPAIFGAAGVLALGNDLYVTGLLAFSFMKFNATTGAVDPTFNSNTGVVSGLDFPQGIAVAPGGKELLVGILGPSDGNGTMSRYKFDGTFIDEFAPPVTDPADGFLEATAFIVVPEPTSFLLAGIALVALGFMARRRNAR